MLLENAVLIWMDEEFEKRIWKNATGVEAERLFCDKVKNKMKKRSVWFHALRFLTKIFISSGNHTATYTGGSIHRAGQEVRHDCPFP